MVLYRTRRNHSALFFTFPTCIPKFNFRSGLRKFSKGTSSMSSKLKIHHRTRPPETHLRSSSNLDSGLKVAIKTEVRQLSFIRRAGLKPRAVDAIFMVKLSKFFIEFSYPVTILVKHINSAKFPPDSAGLSAIECLCVSSLKFRWDTSCICFTFLEILNWIVPIFEAIDYVSTSTDGVQHIVELLSIVVLANLRYMVSTDFLVALNYLLHHLDEFDSSEDVNMIFPSHTVALLQFLKRPFPFRVWFARKGVGIYCAKHLSMIRYFAGVPEVGTASSISTKILDNEHFVVHFFTAFLFAIHRYEISFLVIAYELVAQATNLEQPNMLHLIQLLQLVRVSFPFHELVDVTRQGSHFIHMDAAFATQEDTKLVAYYWNYPAKSAELKWLTLTNVGSGFWRGLADLDVLVRQWLILNNHKIKIIFEEFPCYKVKCSIVEGTRCVDALILYFGQDLSPYPFEQVVSTLLNFARMFSRVHGKKQLQMWVLFYNVWAFYLFLPRVSSNVHCSAFFSSKSPSLVDGWAEQILSTVGTFDSIAPGVLLKNDCGIKWEVHWKMYAAGFRMCFLDMITTHCYFIWDPGLDTYLLPNLEDKIVNIVICLLSGLVMFALHAQRRNLILFEAKRYFWHDNEHKSYLRTWQFLIPLVYVQWEVLYFLTGVVLHWQKLLRDQKFLGGVSGFPFPTSSSSSPMIWYQSILSGTMGIAANTGCVKEQETHTRPKELPSGVGLPKTTAGHGVLIWDPGIAVVCDISQTLRTRFVLKGVGLSWIGPKQLSPCNFKALTSHVTSI